MTFGLTKAARLALVALVLALLGATAGAARANGGGGGDVSPPLTLQFLGQQIFPTSTQFQGTTFGGLSGFAYDHRRRVYYALSDDQVNVRFYTLRIGISTAGPAVEIVGVTTLRDASGQPFAAMSLDPEGLALTGNDTLAITSEGFAARLIDPWVREFGLDGRERSSFPVPSAFLPVADGSRGVRQNLGFESAGVAPSGRYLFTGAENAVVQDGPPATLAAGSPARLLRYDLATKTLDRQFVYQTDPIAEPPVPSNQFAVSGLVEIIPLDKDSLLTMERSFSVGAPGTGNTIRLYQAELGKATDVNGFDSLATLLGSIRPAEKRLVLDLKQLGIPLDNVEGMAFAPRLKDGRRTLLLVSDNNFSPTAFTQFLLFAVTE
jgi:3-phytase